MIRMISRRTFVRKSVIASAGLAAAQQALLLKAADPSDIPPDPARRKVCAFIKFIQDLEFDRLGAEMASIGLDGVEATIRPGGIITPDQVQDKLPLLVDALKKHGIEITIMASHVNRADDPVMRQVLETASTLGIRQYRMAYYRYDRDINVSKTLSESRAILKDLAQLNAELGIQALYQNHAGLRYVGAGIWDIVSILEDIDPAQVALAFDIRHATVEGGFSWPVDWKHALPHVRAAYLKDFEWNDGKVRNVPLGTGMVQMTEFIRLLKTDTPLSVPISLHIEYLDHEGTDPNLRAIRSDFQKLNSILP